MSNIIDVGAESSTYDHRSVKTGHPVRNPPFSPSFVDTGSQRVVV